MKARPEITLDYIRVARSPIHGRGVFATRNILQGARVIEYKGKRRPPPQFVPEDANGNPAPGYLFLLREGVVIDGADGGNEARFINHSCEPNCRAAIVRNRVYIHARTNIARGEELSLDYKLRGAALSAADAQKHACRCGSRKCRGTMLAPA